MCIPQGVKRLLEMATATARIKSRKQIKAVLWLSTHIIEVGEMSARAIVEVWTGDTHSINYSLSSVCHAPKKEATIIYKKKRKANMCLCLCGS